MVAEARAGGDSVHRTSLTISRESWAYLVRVFDETGARPSVTVDRLIDRERRAGGPARAKSRRQQAKDRR